MPVRFPAGMVSWAAPVVNLTAEQVSYCARIAAERRQRNKAAGVRDRFNSNTNKQEAEVRGLLGEYAFAKMMQMPTDHMDDTTPRSVYTDTDQDLLLNDGSTVDVKTTFNSWADIHISRHKERNPATYYGLLIVDQQPTRANGFVASLSFRGYIPGNEAVNASNLQRVRSRQNNQFYVVPQAQLVHALPPNSQIAAQAAAPRS